MHNTERTLFEARLNLKPYEYPELEEYKEAIQHSYWLHTEFNYTSDIHDFFTNVTAKERNAIKNAMLAIAQVEVTVKDFWGDLRHRMPKPELSSVGYTFSESEVRHHDAYAHLLELLGLNEEFKQIEEIPALIQRVNYLESHKRFSKTGNNRDYTISLILFSLFIEHVSLFSQFLIIMSFNKHQNIFKGMSNAIEATSKEEQIHGLFGSELVNILREEHPEWFDEEMEDIILQEAKKAYASEEKVIEWIFEEGELDFLPVQRVKEFVKNRLNESLDGIGYERIFEIDEEEVKKTDWFMDELLSTKHLDFFVKRSTNYTKRSKSITSDDLF
ncbi:MAG: ribonucleotide-diphosphate reductase subunit beta [Atopostipes suicloacalis]|nr:ribonucleotide-diphosphate reductase subunit beta [Atopostipes suicloacalis]